MDAVVRPCTREDLPAVGKLLAELSEVARGQALPDLARREVLLAEMEAEPGTYLNLVAEREGRVVGFLSLVFYRTFFHEGGTALINELVVRRDLRRAGIGRALVDRAQAEAKARGMDELEVGTERTNEPALAFYRKAGFEQEYVLLGMEFE
ncbi:MAG: N-acetyltransferase family protein [Chitinophagales bacterium]